MNGNDSKRLHTFESNRLTVIRNGSSVSDWRYINQDDNSADDASKGLRPASKNGKRSPMVEWSHIPLERRRQLAHNDRGSAIKGQ